MAKTLFYNYINNTNTTQTHLIYSLPPPSLSPLLKTPYVITTMEHVDQVITVNINTSHLTKLDT